MAKDERADRLAAALRENLKRRKAQSRGLPEASERRDPAEDQAHAAQPEREDKA